MKREKLIKLNEEHTKLARFLFGNEMAMRSALEKARKAQGLERWQVAEKLGWKLSRVEAIEDDLGHDPKWSEIRYYLLAIGCYFNFQIHSEKNLG